MAAIYSKLFKVVTDTPLPYSEVNRLKENVTAANNAMIAAHGVIEPQEAADHSLRNAPRVLQYGHHSDQRIPRSSVNLMAVAITPTIAILDSTTLDQHVTSLSRLGTGAYFLEIAGLSTWWGHGVPTSTGTGVVRWVNVRAYVPTSTQSGKPGLYCTCYDLSGGDFVATDYDFWLTIYGAA